MFLALFVVKKQETDKLLFLLRFYVVFKMSTILNRDFFRSESTLKSIKLQYGAEIDGWRAKYEEAQVKNQNQNIKSKYEES